MTNTVLSYLTIVLCAAAVPTVLGQYSSLQYYLHSKREINCRGYKALPGTLGIGGDVLKKLGDGYSERECMDACSEDSDCIAALVRTGGKCYLLGYRMRTDYYTTNYQRICENGANCFQRHTGFTASTGAVLPGTTIQVPWKYAWNPSYKELFCMATCQNYRGNSDAMTERCIGFDLQRNQAKCKLMTMTLNPIPIFSTFLRQCS